MEIDRRNNFSQKRNTYDASDDVVVFKKLTPYELKELKESLLNIVCAALIQQPKMSVTDPTIRKITKLVKQIAFYDPEFVLKMAMYVRLDLNIRSTANYLLAVASNIEECRPFLKKYFCESIRLPSDWLDVAATYSILPDKGLKGKALPTSLRKVMIAKFPDFDAYQLGKYNKERSIKRKLKKIREEKEKGNKFAKMPDKPMVTLKQMIRVLHINQPHLQVMCLLGKKYPMTQSEFSVSGLYGNFEPEKAGLRMKLPTPETWETLLSEKGNKSSTWEELIDHKKLPFMAMLRNLRNLIYTGVHPRYHKWVCGKLSNKQTVAQSKQFPFQFFSAYEIIPRDLAHFKELMAGEKDSKAGEKDSKKTGKVERKPGTEEKKEVRRKKKKQITPTNMPTDKIFSDYRKAIDQAVKHATTCNVSPIRGSTVVFCNVSSETRVESGSKNMGSSVRSVADIGYLLGLMCKYVCEDCDFRVYSSPSATHPNTNHLGVQLKEGSILENMAAVAEVASQLGLAAGEFPFDYLEDMIRDKRRVDNFLVLSHHVINPQDESGSNSRLSNLLKKYRMEVNPGLLFVSIDLSGSGKSAIGQDERNPNDIQITGFSDQILRFIAERGDTNQLQYVEHIDEAKLKKKKGKEEEHVQWDVSPWWKFLDSSMLDAVTYPNITLGSKWREARIFISSTFIDMHGERDILTRIVLPEIKEKAKQRKIKIYEVDLRWGVTEHESQNNQSIQLCLDEVARCEFFIGILGDRYGWAPAQYEIPDHPRFNWLKSYPKERSITELEIHSAALSDISSFGKNSFFYFRDSSFTSTVPEKYQQFFHEVNQNSANKMEDLKNRISSANLPVFHHYPATFGGLTDDGHPATTGLDILGEKIFHDLWGAIDKRYPNEESILDPIGIERGFHQAFVQDHLERFVGRKEYMDDLQKFVHGFHNQLMVVHGKAGDGKSALLSHFVSNYAEKNPRTFVLPHFISVSPGSTDVRHTLHRLCSELVQVFDLDEVVPEDYKELVSIFPNILEQASFKGKLIIVIDAVNQLDDFLYRSHAMDWLPAKLTCKFIISTLPGKCLDNLRRKFSGTIVEMVLGSLEVKERTELIRQTLWKYHKKLDERPINNQMRDLLKKTDAGNPLYICVACEELRVFGLYEKVTDRIKRMAPTISRLFEEVLKRLETDHGKELVQSCCSYIVLSRGGLLEHELIRILQVDGYMWSGLMRNLSLFLKPAGSAGLISFFHDSFKEAVIKRYLTIKRTAIKYHALLAEFFLSQLDPKNDLSWVGGGDTHALSEVVYHLTSGEKYQALTNVLTDLNFIELKSMCGQAYDLLSDYNDASRDELKYDGKSKVSEFRDFVKSNIHVFLNNPSLVFQQAANEPSSTLPAKNANYFWTKGVEKRSWLEWVNKPQESDSCKMTFSGFSDGVTASAISSDEKLIACATQDCVIKIYNAETSSELVTLVGHTNLISCLKFSPDCSQLASSSWDESIIIWDVKSEFSVAVLKGHERRINSLEYNKDGSYLASASWDTTVKIWDCNNEFKCRYTIQTGERPVNCIAFSSDEKHILAGLWDGTVKSFHIIDETTIGKEGILVATLTGHTKSIQSIAVSPLGKHLVTGSMDQNLFLWDAISNKLISPLSQHSKPVTAVSYTQDGSHLLSASADSTIKVWEANLGNELKSITSRGYILSASFHPSNDNILVTSSSECCITVWDLTKSVEILSVGDLTRPATVVEFSPNGKYIGLACEDAFFILDSTTGVEAIKFTKEENRINVNSLCWSPDGKRLLTASDDCQVRIWDTSSNQGKLIMTCKGHDSAVRSVHFDEKGVTFCSAGRDNTVRVWDSRYGNLLHTFRGHKDWITCCAYNPSGNRIASCGWDMTIRVWNPRSPEKPKAILEGHSSAVGYVRYSPDGNTIVSCSYDGTIKIWDAEAGTELTTLNGHQSGVNGFAFSPKGDILVSVSDDSTIKLWDPLRATEVRTLVGHSDVIRSATFSSESKRVVSASLDKTMKVWDVGLAPKETSFSMNVDTPAIHTEKAELKGHSAMINSISISSETKSMVSSSDDKTLRLWDLETRSCLRKVARLSTIKSCEFVSETTFLTADNSGSVHLWDTRTGNEAIRNLAQHQGPATTVSISSNNTKVISGGWDNKLKVTDLRSQSLTCESNKHTDWILTSSTNKNASKIVSGGWDNDIVYLYGANYSRSHTFIGHSDTVTSINLSATGKFVCSGSYDSTIKIWDTDTFQIVKSFAGHTGRVNSVTFSQNDSIVISGGEDMSVKLWNVKTGHLAGQFFCQAPATVVKSSFINYELEMVFGDSIGNLYLTKLH